MLVDYRQILAATQRLARDLGNIYLSQILNRIIITQEL